MRYVAGITNDMTDADTQMASRAMSIPISSQVVALADVYDALTSKRIYKEAFSHETSIQMILDGECGAFNPLLLECLTDLSDRIKEELNEQRQI